MLIALIATVVLSPTCVTAAREQPSPNAIIFTRWVEGITHLFASYPDGSNVIALDQINTLLPYDVQSGDLFPDGTKLVFSAQSAEIPSGGFPPRELFSYNFFTSSLTQLTDDGEENYQPLWSHDGSKIAYLSNGEYGVLKVMEVATGQVSTLLGGRQIQGYLGRTGYVTGFDWSPLGDELVTSIQLTGPDAFSSLYVVDVLGTTLTRILPDGAIGTQPIWGNNTDEFYYVCNGRREICRLNLADQSTHQLSDVQSEFPDTGIDAMDISVQGTIIFSIQSGSPTNTSNILKYDPTMAELSILSTSSEFSGFPRWAYNFVLGIPTPTSTPTLTPTPPPTSTLTPAPYQRLRLTSMCSSNPAVSRNWRVRNPNPYPVTFTWDVYNSPNQQRGSGVVPAAVGGVQGEVLFSTVTEVGANTLRLFVNGAQQDVKASGGATCN